jgi:hypothetical protein
MWGLLGSCVFVAPFARRCTCHRRSQRDVVPGTYTLRTRNALRLWSAGFRCGSAVAGVVPAPSSTGVCAQAQSSLPRTKGRRLNWRSSIGSWRAGRRSIAPATPCSRHSWMWALMGPDGKPHFDDFCVSSEPAHLEGGIRNQGY